MQQWRRRTRGTPRQLGKAFPLIKKKDLPKLSFRNIRKAKSLSAAKGLNIPKELMSAQLSERMKAKIGYSVDTKKSTGPAMKLGGFTVKKQSINWLKRSAAAKGVSFKVVLMSPSEFLRRAPSMVTIKAPAIMQKASQYHKESVEYAIDAIKHGKPIAIPFLDYSEMKDGYPEHDGRARSFAALNLGVQIIPVAVLGEKELA